MTTADRERFERLRTLHRDYWMLVDPAELPDLHPAGCTCHGVWEEIIRLMDFIACGDASLQ